MRKACVLLVVQLLLGLPGFDSALAQEKRTIAVLDLVPRGIDKSAAANITDLVVKEVDRIGLFRTISMEEIKRMLEHEQQKILLGCDDTSCLAEIGGALGAELLLAGGVGKLGDTFVVSLKLIDVREVKVLRREERTVHGKVENLVEAARAAARTLLAPILEQESGTLSVSCSEEGAEVYVDDVMVGSTPLEPRKVPGGYHAVRISKKSFVVYAKDVKIDPGKNTELHAALLPSRAFIEEYDSRASMHRTLAWTFTAVALAAGGASTGLFVWNNGRLDDHRKDVSAFKASEPQALSLDEINDQADSINLVDSVSLSVAIVGMVSAGVALYFWLTGEEPGRYDDVAAPDSTAAFEIRGQAGPGSAGATAIYRF